MFDPASIAAALGSVKTILDLAKNANDAQLAIKISTEVANVQGKLIEVQQAAIALQLENQELRAAINKFHSYVQHHSVTWRLRPDGKEDGPFCPVCIGEGREMRLILRPHIDQTGENWHLYCPRGHVSDGASTSAWNAPKPEPTYIVPKRLLPEDYFCLG
jgi:hypothetical protein